MMMMIIGDEPFSFVKEVVEMTTVDLVETDPEPQRFPVPSGMCNGEEILTGQLIHPRNGPAAHQGVRLSSSSLAECKTNGGTSGNGEHREEQIK